MGSLIQATDFDGDTAPGGAVQIVVNDDTPIAAVEPQVVSATVVEDALLTTAPGDTGDLSDGNLDAGQDNSGDEALGLAGSLTTLFEEGADEPLTYTLSTGTSRSADAVLEGRCGQLCGCGQWQRHAGRSV